MIKVAIGFGCSFSSILIWMICICFFGNTFFFFLVFDCTDFGAGITGVFCACDVDLFGLCLCG